jgi:iron complex transport system ATP-binding protein
MTLRINGVSLRIDRRLIVQDADLEVGPGEFVGLLGPNGCGKSTLLRSAYRALRPAAGLITVEGDDLVRLSPRESARRTAVVAQETPAELAFTVAEIVAMGRTPHKRPLDRTTEEDELICAQALERVGASHLAGREFATLSGGEKQRVLIARALAQQSRLLLLDEPTNHLDIRHQLEILRLVRDLGVSTLAALHDLNQAAEHCDRLYLMDGGRIVACGTPEEVLTPERISQVSGVRAVPRTQLAFELKEEP